MKYLFSIAAITLLAACGSEPEDVSTVEPTLANVQAKVFSVSCTTASCHATESTTKGEHALDLQSSGVRDRLVNVDPHNADAKAAGFKRVIPGDPDKSLLIEMLVSESGEFGARMPKAGPKLADDKINLIREWIKAGAK